jgi:simple sugar transport system substrate-binding protein/ribose transport system substrate-binding protein
VVQKKPKTAVTTGPYLYMDAVLVDGTNVAQFNK